MCSIYKKQITKYYENTWIYDFDNLSVVRQWVTQKYSIWKSITHDSIFDMDEHFYFHNFLQIMEFVFFWNWKSKPWGTTDCGIFRYSIFFFSVKFTHPKEKNISIK